MTGFVLHPRLEAESLFVRDLPLSQLRLNNIKTVPWLILVPRRADVKEIYRLDANDRAALIEEIAQASHVLDALYAPDKINIAALGNQVHQLHVHVIARFASDVAWPDPVWGKVAMEPYALKAIAEINEKLNTGKFWA